MPILHFVSDLHGDIARYRKLFGSILTDSPLAVFLGGDLLPPLSFARESDNNGIFDFIRDYLAREFASLKEIMGSKYPRVFIILGNDDPRSEEPAVLEVEKSGLWEYLHFRKSSLDSHDLFGYACVPPSPFMIKDWERYDVSRYLEPGDISPEEGIHTVASSVRKIRHGTIKKDLQELIGASYSDKAIFLFHAPPYNTSLDLIAAGNRLIDGVPRDTHQGSIAIRDFIDSRQPFLTMHGHIHESSRLSGKWKETLGKTVIISAAYDGPELALIRIDPTRPFEATRELI